MSSKIIQKIMQEFDTNLNSIRLYQILQNIHPQNIQ